MSNVTFEYFHLRDIILCVQMEDKLIFGLKPLKWQ